MTDPADTPLTRAVKAGADALNEQIITDWWQINTGHDWPQDAELRAVANVVLRAALPVLADALRAESCVRYGLMRRNPVERHRALGLYDAAAALDAWASEGDQQ